MLGKRTAVVSEGRPEHLDTLVGQHQVHASTVVRTRPTGHEAVPLQTVGQTGGAAGAERDLLGELAHRQAAVRRSGDPQQHFEGLEADAIAATELGIEQPGEPLVRFEEKPEGVDAIERLAVGLLGGHACQDTRRYLRKK